jgi:hypothetical protein
MLSGSLTEVGQATPQLLHFRSRVAILCGGNRVPNFRRANYDANKEILYYLL